jgi:hypothetical protein
MPFVSDFSGWGGYAGPIMRTLAILLAALAISLTPSAALAKNDKTPPGQAIKSDKPEPPGQAKNADKPDPPGQSKNSGKANPPGLNKPDDSPGSAAVPSNTDADEAQRAVERHEALPLAKIIKIAEGQTTGRVIDARLVRASGVLLYQLTFLDDTGRSWRAYFYARSGNPVTTR